MSSKIYYTNIIASKRKELISLRDDIKSVKERKKKNIDSINTSLKNTNSASMKVIYRKNRENEKRDSENKIENLKRKIENVKKEITRLTELKSKIK